MRKSFVNLVQKKTVGRTVSAYTTLGTGVMAAEGQQSAIKSQLC